MLTVNYLHFVFINPNKAGYLLLYATLTTHIYFTKYTISYANGTKYSIENITKWCKIHLDIFLNFRLNFDMFLVLKTETFFKKSFHHTGFHTKFSFHKLSTNS